MAQRLATEGDNTMGAFRYKHVHGFGQRYMRPEHQMPTSTRTSHQNGSVEPEFNTTKTPHGE
jgi:hypothetical protein